MELSPIERMALYEFGVDIENPSMYTAEDLGNSLRDIDFGEVLVASGGFDVGGDRWYSSLKDGEESLVNQDLTILQRTVRYDARLYCINTSGLLLEVCHGGWIPGRTAVRVENTSNIALKYRTKIRETPTRDRIVHTDFDINNDTVLMVAPYHKDHRHAMWKVLAEMVDATVLQHAQTGRYRGIVDAQNDFSLQAMTPTHKSQTDHYLSVRSPIKMPHISGDYVQDTHGFSYFLTMPKNNVGKIVALCQESLELIRG